MPGRYVELPREMLVEKSLQFRLCECPAHKAHFLSTRFVKVVGLLYCSENALGNEVGPLFQAMQLRDPRILSTG